MLLVRWLALPRVLFDSCCSARPSLERALAHPPLAHHCSCHNVGPAPVTVTATEHIANEWRWLPHCT